MRDNRTVGQLTLHTLRFIANDYSRMRKLKETTSVDSVKKIIWDAINPTIHTIEEKEGFLKGIKLCDFNAIYEWKMENLTPTINPTTARAPQGVQQLQDVKQKRGESEVCLVDGE